MNKKYLLVILAIVFFVWFTNKAKAQKTEPLPPPTPLIPENPNLVWSSNNIVIKSGDTFYKLAERIWDEEHAGPKSKDKIIKFAKQNAQANGFNWDLYDDKATNDLRDPDTLKPGQKIVMYTWLSFNENAPTIGLIMPGQQVNAFNTFDTL